MLKAVPLANDYVVQEHGEEGMFATLFFGVFDAETGALSYINCGHEPLFITGGNGIREKLGPTGPALGLISGTRFNIRTARLEPGEVLFGYTDGVTEARSASDALFTRDRLEQVQFMELNAVTARLVELTRDNVGATARELLNQLAVESGVDAEPLLEYGTGQLQDLLERGVLAVAGRPDAAQS